ncbi:hypothetical protein Poli38472_004573 [Pythium oligandrum]|uniref:Reverse transcriptase Ty1/copia-type domain-containing protein n=1 Tax=Pythium oligandrum TaxID=41045 RepID=A0A8K1FG08_PYTOL|nr:hypothetical protein Poli38472_004573 [Pythium oligandrum]|eukprot:TMW59504.1 hypothetical protein Poli38472_004573 [Pythium oligandrum]
MGSIRIFLSVCCAAGYILEQLDVDTAFLNADLKEDVYIEPPEGLKVDGDCVLKLNKALYGLKQAGNAWFKTIHGALIDLGFKPCGSDTCIYVGRAGGDTTYICLYVDDMVVGGRTQTRVDEVKKLIAARFRIKELGPVKHLLGMEIVYDRVKRYLSINQAQYVKTLVERFNQQSCRDVTNPCEQSLKLSKADGPRDDQQKAEMSKRPYRSLIGCLQYVAQCTRPDIAFAVTHLSRFMENPGPRHWTAAIRVLRYLKSTRDYGISYGGDHEENTPVVFCDADWGTSVDDRRSVSGLVIMMNGGPIVFKAKYQSTVALSSSEAEYLALSLCGQEVMWVRTMLHDLGINIKKPIQVWEDNQGAIALAHNAGYHARTKHIDIRHHYVRDLVADSVIKLSYVETQRQLADILTKSLGTKRFEFLRELMRVKPTEIPPSQQ